MRPLSIAQKAAIKDPAARAAIVEIERASRMADVQTIAAAFTITNPPATPVRTLDATGATPQQVRDYIATLTADLQRGGANRST
jgi:hypothetical protein